MITPCYNISGASGVSSISASYFLSDYNTDNNYSYGAYYYYYGNSLFGSTSYCEVYNY